LLQTSCGQAFANASAWPSFQDAGQAAGIVAEIGKALAQTPTVIASHSRSKNGVASLAYGEAIQRARSAQTKNAAYAAGSDWIASSQPDRRDAPIRQLLAMTVWLTPP
jgi:hypothetical protein